ncbi:MAG: M23 family metallopeptidase [Anaerolineae bacterium]|nr:M23 family metallopeptidase [Anaerolineae bacterium]
MPLFVSCVLVALLIACAGLLIAYLVISREPAAAPERPPATFPADSAPATLSPEQVLDAALGIGTVTIDPTGRYAFPLAADPRQYVWTHLHWDDSNAADIEIRPGVPHAEFDRLARAPLVAFTAGAVTVYNGSAGGLGYILHGEDGLDYYYGHMAEQRVPDGAFVATGQTLGVLGNTGANAQFIEPHLHFAIGPRDSLWTQPPAVNAAEHIASLFGLGWQDRPAPAIPFALPEGWPVQHPALRVLTPFEQAESNGLAQPAIELASGTPHPTPPRM